MKREYVTGIRRFTDSDFFFDHEGLIEKMKLIFMWQWAVSYTHLIQMRELKILAPLEREIFHLLFF